MARMRGQIEPASPQESPQSGTAPMRTELLLGEGDGVTSTFGHDGGGQIYSHLSLVLVVDSTDERKSAFSNKLFSPFTDPRSSCLRHSTQLTLAR